ncbi:unnamed protein product [Closterium sp. NIES-53]
MCSSSRFLQRERRLPRDVIITVANNENLRTNKLGIVELQSNETNVILQLNKVLVVDNLGFNLLSVSQLMSKGIHLECDSNAREIRLYHGKGGVFIGRAIQQDDVFVLDFVPDKGTADSDGIVAFAPWTHPPDLDPNFSPGGFCQYPSSKQQRQPKQYHQPPNLQSKNHPSSRNHLPKLHSQIPPPHHHHLPSSTRHQQPSNS